MRHGSVYFALLCCYFNHVYADVRPHEEEIEELVVTGRYDDTAISASQGKITQEQLAKRPILRTGEILEAVPGLVATQHSGSGKANQYFLRGFNLDHGTDFATSVDKMPVNMRTHGHGQGYTDLNFLISELVDEITYKKGSYYADVGDFSGTGGAIIRTKNVFNGHKIKLGFGENGFARALSLGESTLYEKTNLIYGLALQKYNGPWDAINEDVHKTNALLKLASEGEGNKKSIALMYYDNSWNSADQIPSRAVEQDLISELGSIDETVGGKSSRYSLSGNWLGKIAGGELDANFYFIHYDLDLWSNFTYFTDPDGDQFHQKDDRNIYGWDIAYQVNQALGDHSMTNTFGTQFRYDDITEVGLFNSFERMDTDVYRLDAVEEYSVSIYWENIIRWNHHFRTIIGARNDYFDFNVNPQNARIQSSTLVNGGKVDDSITTGSLSLIYSFTDNFETYFSIGQGFHSNDARGTTIEQDPNSGEIIEKVDPLVDTLGYELGSRFHIANRIDLSLALWYLNIDSELLFVGDEGTTESTGVGSKRSGAELTIYYKLGNRFGLDFEYAYTNARFETKIDGSDDVPGALDTVISAGINVDWSDFAFSHLRLRHFSDYPLGGGAIGQASTLVNLRFGYNIGDRISLTFDVLNLLDRNDRDIEYFYESQLLTENEPVNDVHYHVLEPRTFRMYASYSF